MENMVYLRKMNETLEIAHPLNKVWLAIQKAVISLGWDVEQIDAVTHRVRAKTKEGFMLWNTMLLIEALRVSGKNYESCNCN